jgi:hypothetical protein
MRKFNPSFNSFVLVSALAASLVATNVHAQTHHHRGVESAYQEFRPFADTAPKFAGFFGNLGLGYNMHSGSISYTDTFTPTGAFSSDVSASQSASKSNISGLLKFGYAWRMGERGYLGIAALYNAAAEQKLMDVTYQYGAGTNPVQIQNTVKQGNSLGLMLEPGYLIDMKSMVYANVGVQMDDFKFQTQEVNGADTEALSTNKKPMNYVVGFGYQRQMLTSPKLRNLTWFAEMNYTMGSKMNVAQSIVPPNVGPTQPARSETYSFSPTNLQLVLGVNYYI